MGLMMKNVNISGVHKKDNIERRDCLKRGLGQYADLGGGGVSVFEDEGGSVDTPMHNIIGRFYHSTHSVILLQ